MQEGKKMRAIVVYYSLTGNSAYVAKKVSDLLDADMLRIETKKEFPKEGARKFLWGGKSAVMGEMPDLLPYAFDPDAYDIVILGCPVWASNPAPPVKTFVRNNLQVLQKKQVSAFLCFGGGGADKAFARLEKQLGKDLMTKLVLVDPKDAPDAANDEKIKMFCRQLQDVYRG